MFRKLRAAWKPQSAVWSPFALAAWAAVSAATEDTTPQHAAACDALWERSGGFVNVGPYTPFVFHEDGAQPRSTLQLPGALGGVNWGGAAADPTRGLLFMHANDSSLVGWIERKRPGENYGNGTEGSTIPYDRGSADGAGPYFTFSAPVMNEAGERLGSLPCYRPPWSRLLVIASSFNFGGTLEKPAVPAKRA